MKISSTTLNYVKAIKNGEISKDLGVGHVVDSYDCKPDRMYKDEICRFVGEENALYIPVKVHGSPVSSIPGPVLFLMVFNGMNTIVSRSPIDRMVDVGEAQLTN